MAVCLDVDLFLSQNHAQPNPRECQSNEATQIRSDYLRVRDEFGGVRNVGHLGDANPDMSVPIRDVSAERCHMGVPQGPLTYLAFATIGREFLFQARDGPRRRIASGGLTDLAFRRSPK
jgi:hypothetical protein